MKRIANMTPEELDALTRGDLIARIRELEPPPPSDWHSWMDALLHIVLHRYPVTIEREFVLGNQPPRADFLVLMENEIVDLGLEIFRNFREHNLIEFKSPDDALDESVLWKCIGYVGFYISLKGIPSSQVTLTLIRGAKPAQMFRRMANFIIPDKTVDGVYHIKGWQLDLPIQVIVTTELTGPEYAGFRAISNKPSVEDITQMFRNHEQEDDPELIVHYRAYWNVSARLTGDILEEARRREQFMAKSLLDIVKPEVDEMIDRAVQTTISNHLYLYVQDGNMAIDTAARYAGLSTAEFTARMAEAGYTVPKPA